MSNEPRPLLTYYGVLLPSEYTIEDSTLREFEATPYVADKDFAKFAVKVRRWGVLKYRGKKHWCLPRFVLDRVANPNPVFYISHYGFYTRYDDNPLLNINLQLKEDQKIAANEINKRFSKKLADAGLSVLLLKLDAGMGKTFISGYAINLLAKNYRLRRVLYIVPSIALMNQAKDDLSKIFPEAIIKTQTEMDKSSRLSSIARANFNICIAVINTALSYNVDFMKNIGFTIYDEIHRYCSPTRLEVFRKTAAKFALGMSATIGERNDRMDKIAIMELGDIIDANPAGHNEFNEFNVVNELNKFNEFYELNEENNDKNDILPVFKTKVAVVRYYGPDKYTQTIRHEKTNKVFSPYMIKQFCEDEYRMRLAKDIIESIYVNTEHSLYVFSEYLEPLYWLQSNLSVPVSLFNAGTTQEAIEKAKTDSRIILLSYIYGSEGLSINKMTAIVFLTPRKSNIKQIIGRILRRGGDITKQRLIVDIVDQKTSKMRQFYERKKQYLERGMELFEYKVKYEEVEAENANETIKEIIKEIEL